LEPDILIVDEVLAVGDVEFQKKALGKMKDVSAKEGRTVLFVSHNMTAINTLCQKVFLMSNGVNNFIGPTQEGLKKYLHQNSLHLTNKNINDQILNLPKDEVFRLKKMNLSQEDSNGFEFYSNLPIKISIEYEVFKETTGLRIGFDLIEAETELKIFRSFNDDLYDEIKPVKIGTYLSEAEIPSNLLNEGLYNFSPTIGIHNIRWILYESIKQSFTINNIAGVNKIYSEKRPGVIKPAIKWSTF